MTVNVYKRLYKNYRNRKLKCNSDENYSMGNQPNKSDKDSDSEPEEYYGENEPTPADNVYATSDGMYIDRVGEPPIKIE